MIAAAACVSACGSSPAAPTPAPPAPANFFEMGNLTVESCFAISTTAFSCTYHGLAQNTGSGCGTNVRGVTKSYPSQNAAVFDSNAWAYGGPVKPGEQFVYAGSGLLIPNVTGWTYDTSFTWDNVACS